MSEPIPFRHKFTISGLSSACDRITAHPFIEWHFYETFIIRFYPMGIDEYCSEYVSFAVYNRYYLKYQLISCKISIKNNKNEKLFVKELIMKMGEEEIIKEYIKRDYLLDPANGLKIDDQFTFCLEGWVYYKENSTFQTNLVNDAELRRHNFDFRLLLSIKSLTLKGTIENFMDLFESNKSIELPQIKYLTETDEEIFHPRINIKKDFKKLLFELKSDYKGPYVIETSVIDINQQKCHDKKDSSDWSIRDLIHKYDIVEEIYSNQSILTDNRLTLFCKISLIPELIRQDNELLPYSQILECFKVPPALQMTECTIDGKTGEILQNKVVPLLSSTGEKEIEIEIEKLEQLSTIISDQTCAIDKIIINVNNVYHEHYFEHSNIKNSLLNTKAKKSVFGNVSIKEDCVPMISKLENILTSEIKQIIEQNEQMYTEMPSMKSSTDDLLAQVLEKNNLLSENQQEMKKEIIELQNELNKMKHTKKVKQSKMKKIVDRIIELLNRIKYQLNKVGTNIKRVRKSKTPKSHKLKNSIADFIEPHTSSLVKYVQRVPTSESISDEIKENHINNLETVKNFLVEHLPTESYSVNYQNDDHFEVTLENAEHMLSDIIDDQKSDGDKKLLTRLRHLIVHHFSVRKLCSRE